MNLIQLLTNENPIMIKILTFLLSPIEALLFYQLLFYVLKFEFNKRNALIFTSVMTFVSGLTAFLTNSLLKDLINISAFTLLIHFLLHQNFKNTFLGLICSYFVLLLSEYISESILIHALNCELNSIVTVPIYYFLAIFLALLLYGIFNIFVKYITHRKFSLKFKIPLKVSIGINLVLGIITMILEAYLLSVYTDVIPFSLTLIIIFTLLLYFLISMYSIVRTNILEKTKADLENEILYNKTLTVMHDNIRSFKHDFNNIVQAIGGYVELNDMNGLREYYKRLLDDCKLNNNLNLLNPQTINNPSIYSLLTNKYYTASQKNINMTFSIFSDLSKINFNIYELTRILGILLDNAIEAAEETEEKIIDIEFVSDTKKQLFIIKNSCADSNISTTKIFEKGYSTKKNNTGIGLWKVHKILSKNTNIDLFTTVQNNIFSQQLEVFYE